MSNNNWEKSAYDLLYAWRKPIVWIVLLVIFTTLAIRMQELFLLLLASYGVALLLDPIVSKMTGKRLSRSGAIMAIGGLTVVLFFAALAFIIPSLIHQYNNLINQLPSSLAAAYNNINKILEDVFGWELPHSAESIMDSVRAYISAISSEQIKTVLLAVSKTLLSGYSLTLTIVNLLLVPLFIFYLTRDLRGIHRFLGSFLAPSMRQKTATICQEILGQVYAFFKGQLIVALILALLYVVGFSLIRLPFAIVVGTITGLLGIVPYLGTMIGIVLSIVLTIMAPFSWWDLLQVFIVFGINNLLEGLFITPKIVGDKIGIHPLAVMVALIIGGQLLGLVGLILALPAYAAIRVLLKHVFKDLNIK